MFSDITLEMSLKPFKQIDYESIQRVCTAVFEQWRPLIKNRKQVSVLLWVGDGSELLDYAGNLDDSFEWARFVGTANLPYLQEGEPLETSLHDRKQDYIPHAPTMTYGILKTIIACLRAEGEKACPNATVRIGETFDIGPEFAISDFRYRRHRECLSLSSDCDGYGFLDVSSLLHGDTRPYAAYPEGIPDKTPFVTFMAKQTKAFFADLGFDYLWLSNGLGFSPDPWKKTGKLFDGERYYVEKLPQTKKKVFEFWTLFRENCDVPLETRGTNNSVGIDYASDGVPLYDIYNAYPDMVAPPNSPWAALNDNFGLEMMGHMTRICHLPNEKFPFRYYLHDPWWLNSPWYDRYDGSPCDIYLPMSVSRIDEKQNVQAANKLNLLSIDNSYGGMPDACVYEPLPHLLKAEKDSPDEPAPLVWIYPMREYSTTEDAALLREMNLGDNFICDAINDGFPLCCVTSTDNFLLHDASLYRKSILLSPVPVEPSVLDKLLSLSKEGIGVILYGSKELLASQKEALSPFITVEIQKGASQLRECLSRFGFDIRFHKKDPATKPPTLSLFRHDSALMLSAYNANTTTETCLRFPFGSPILCGMEAEISHEGARYHFARGEHRECRVFVDQSDGVISCREWPPKYTRFRRALRITGLKNATVRLVSETGCECAVSTIKTTYSPMYDPRFSPAYDPRLGWHLLGENVSGEIYFLIGHRNTQSY